MSEKRKTSLFFCTLLLCPNFPGQEERGMITMKPLWIRFQKQWKIILFCFALSALFLLICTKSSFLYPINDWNDSNCFFTVGKGMMQGKVPYRDLFEQKGPLLYFIHGLASLISFDSFLGVFFFEILSFGIFLWFSYRIIFLLNKKTVKRDKGGQSMNKI